MRSSWSLAPLFAAVGGIAISPLGHSAPLTPMAWVIAAALMLAGALLLSKRRFAFGVAIAVAALTALTGVLALSGRPEWALPVKPWLSVGVGIYLLLRAVMGLMAGGPRRSFLPARDLVPPRPDDADAQK